MNDTIYQMIKQSLTAYQTLYDQLMHLCNTNEAFYFADHDDDGVTRNRIFSYRLASYSDFLLPGALEARGIMFQVDSATQTKVYALQSRPPAKFFNIGENPLTMDLDYSKIQHSFIKEDGSLISTWCDAVVGMGEDFETQSEWVLRLKSKTSTSSDQANAALKWVQLHRDYYDTLLDWTLRGWTVNCEWCSPDNRIVVGYEQPKLIVLNARNRQSGAYAPRAELEAAFGEYLVGEGQMVRSSEDLEELAEHTGYEGVILQFEPGYRVDFVKFKNKWYLHRHRTKDSVNNANALFDAVLHEATDDLRTLFLEDVVALKRIEDMEQLVIPLYNHYVRSVEQFHEENKHLERKDYAIKAQAEFPQAKSPLNKITFSSIMSVYQGKNPNYKELLSKHKRSFITMKDLEAE